MMRYTDRDCYASLIRVAAFLNEHNAASTDYGVKIPQGLKWSKKLGELAEQLEVPTQHPENGAISFFHLDHAPSCYGGGVRPALCLKGTSGEYTPAWWAPSAGLGPGAVPRKEFCYILHGVERSLDLLRSETES